MNHQPYEEWLLREPDHLKDQLSAQEYTDFQLHLEECKSCQSLSVAWRETENELRTAPIISPEPGFTNRWLVRLEQKRRQSRKQQTAVMLIVTIASALLLLSLLTFTVLPWINNPNVFIWSYLYRFTKVYSYFNTIGNIAGILFSATARLIPISWLIFMVGIICELGVLWIVFYRILIFQRRIVQ